MIQRLIELQKKQNKSSMVFYGNSKSFVSIGPSYIINSSSIYSIFNQTVIYTLSVFAISY
jgi:hypothetical protein